MGVVKKCVDSNTAEFVFIINLFTQRVPNLTMNISIFSKKLKFDEYNEVLERV